MDRQDPIPFRRFASELRSGRFRAELRSGWSIALLYRAPGVGLAWLCARAGLSPLAVSLTAFLLAASMPLQAALLPIGIAPLMLCLSGALFQILDCADGTLARGTGRTSKTGADLDFLIDMAQWGLLYLSLGLLADRLLDSSYGWAALGAAAGWGRLMARVIRDRLAEQGEAAPPGPLRPLDLPSLFLGGISGLIPFLALSGDWIGVAVIALMIYSLLDIVEALVPLARRA